MRPQKPTRRAFLGASGLAAATPLVHSCRRERSRPNVLWITCEDLSPVLGCYGDTYAHTPNLDRLASQGVRYTRAFSTAPVCTPARSCLITGVHAASLGTQHLRGEMPLPRDVRPYTELLRESGYYCTNNLKEDYNFPTPKTAWDESSAKAHWRNRPPGAPFFSIFNLMTTHQSQIRYSQAELDKVNETLAPEERHDPARAPLPPYYPDTPLVRHNIATLYTQVTRMDKQAGQLLAELDAAGLAGETIVFFYSDHGTGLPRGKRWLHDSGLRVPLIIRFPEKYRDLAPAPPGSTDDRLISFADFPPAMLGLTGLAAPKWAQGRAFLGAGREDTNEYVFATGDRVDEVLVVSRAARDSRFRYIRNYLPHRPRMPRSDFSEITPIRRELRRLAAEGKLSGDGAWLMQPRVPPEELYDCEADPHNIRNLAGEPAHRGTLERLRAALRGWMLEIRDTGFLPEPEMARRSAGGSPYDMARRPEAYPLEKILSTAELAGRGAGELAKLETALSDSDPAVRYWATVGLAALGPEAAPAAASLRRLLADGNAATRIGAAEALAGLGFEREALPVLERAVQDPDGRVALMAGISLTALGKKAAPAIPVIRKALKGKIEPATHAQYLEWALNGIVEQG